MGVLDLLIGANASAYDRQVQADTELQKQGAKTLFDMMTEQMQEKRLKAAAGTPALPQEVMPSDQMGPPRPAQPGTGIYAPYSPGEGASLESQILMANINDKAFAPAFTNTMQTPWNREKLTTEQTAQTERNNDDNARMLEIKQLEGQQQIELAEYNRTHRAPPEIGKSYDFLEEKNGTTYKATKVWDGEKFVREGEGGRAYSPSSGGGSGGGSEDYPFLARLALEKGVVFDKTSRKLGYLEQVVKGYAATHDGAMPEADWVLGNIAEAKIKGDTAATSKVTEQKVNLDAAKSLISRFETAGKKLDFSNNAWVSWTQEKIKSVFSPQELTDLRSLSVDLVQTLARAYAGKGATDKAVELEKWAASDHPSPLVAAAYAKSQLRSAQERIGFMVDMYGAPKSIPAPTPAAPAQGGAISSYAAFKAQTGRK